MKPPFRKKSSFVFLWTVFIMSSVDFLFPFVNMEIYFCVILFFFFFFGKRMSILKNNNKAK